MLRRAGFTLCLTFVLLLWWAVAHRQTVASPPDRIGLQARTGAPGGATPVPDAVQGVVSGRVTRDGGLPAVGFTVRAIPASLPSLRYAKDNPNTAVTDADGRYTLTLHVMRFFYYSGPMFANRKGYTVSVSNGGQPYIEPPTRTVDPAAQPGHAISNLDFVLRLGPQVTVHAQDAITHAPISGVAIRYEAPWPSDGAVGVTGPDGVLRFRVPLTDIRLQADTGHAPVQIAPGYGLFKHITAVPGQEVAWEIKTYGTTNAAVYNSDWHGVVLAPDGHPAAGVAVAVLRTSSYPPGVTALVTDAAGHFAARLPRLENGESGEWNPHTPPVIFARQGALAAAQVVTPDESWDGMTLHLAPGAAFTGTVTDMRGRPVPGVAVGLTGSILGVAQLLPTPPETQTDDQGRFTLAGLPPGNYQVHVHGGGYGDLVIPAAVLDPHLVQPLLALTAGQCRDIGRVAVPRSDRTLAGRVVDERGHPVPRLWVSVAGTHTHETAVTQHDGTFHAYDLVAEPLTVTVGLAEHTVTATVTPGPNGSNVRLIAPPDVIAANRGAPPSPPLPTPPSPPTAVPGLVSANLDGLGVVIRQSDGGGFRAAVVRPNSLAAYGPLLPMLSAAGTGGPPPVWEGALADLDGMRLAVRADRGTLSDRVGRVLWSGAVVDPPDYTVTSDGSHGKSAVTIRVVDRQGRTLWHGPTPWDASGDVVREGAIRVIGSNHRVAWERVIGDARVSQHWIGPPGSFEPDPTPTDGTLTLHVTGATATLRAADGHTLLSLPTPVVMTTQSGFPVLRVGGKLIPDSAPIPRKNGRIDQDWLAWQIHRFSLMPPDIFYPLILRDTPHGSTLTLTDQSGRPLPRGAQHFQ